MQTARRLYLYLMSGVSLGVLVSGLSMLLGVLLEVFGVAGDQLSGGGQVIGQRLTLATAMTVVSVPVWLIHWIFVERAVLRERPTASEERSSGVRGLYFALAMGSLLIATAVSAVGLIEVGVLVLAGEPYEFRNPAGNLALLAIAGLAWSYHIRLRSRDWSVRRLTGAGAYLPRAYLYVAGFAGLLAMLFGITGLIELAGRVALNRPPEFIPGDSGAWWALPLASALAQTLVGGAIWIGHARYANRLLADPGWRGSAERAARLRLAYFLAAVVAGAAAVIAFSASAGREAIAAALGVADLPVGPELAAVIGSAVLSAIVFGLAWWMHSRWLRGEAAVSELPGRSDTARRLTGYALALVGLAAGAVSAALLIGLLVDLLFSGSQPLTGSGFGRGELAAQLPYVVLGGTIWIWNWTQIRGRLARYPIPEATSTIRRTFLLLVLAVAILAGIASLGVILYRIFGAVFGVELAGNPVTEISRPLGGLIVALTVAGYHAVALRRDQALRTQPAPAPPETVIAPAVVTLRLSGPPDVELEPIVAELRRGLPSGYTLERVPGSGDERLSGPDDT